MKKITIGKIRGLRQCSTRRGAISVLAIDHRNNLRAALRPGAPDQVPAQELEGFKDEVVRWISPSSTAILTDPQYGAAQVTSSGALPGGSGLLVALEASGYTGQATARHSQVLTGWSVEKTRSMGASAVKLLVYYHPEASTTGEIEDLVCQVSRSCQAADLPLFLETLSYSTDPRSKKLSSAEKRRVVIETARRLTPLGAEVLKAEFPLDIQAEGDEKEWRKACEELSVASTIPWVLLSASVSFETFLRQVSVACLAGASGVAVGRAVWQEATSLSGEARGSFLRDVAGPRMQRITDLCEALARPWMEFFEMPQPGDRWYMDY
jgi:tagatose 1,6-diphosphate aldolase